MDRNEFARLVGQLAQRWEEGPPCAQEDPALERWRSAFHDEVDALRGRSDIGMLGLRSAVLMTLSDQSRKRLEWKPSPGIELGRHLSSR